MDGLHCDRLRPHALPTLGTLFFELGAFKLEPLIFFVEVVSDSFLRTSNATKNV